jgi:hypothetical protein
MSQYQNIKRRNGLLILVEDTVRGVYICEHERRAPGDAPGFYARTVSGFRELFQRAGFSVDLAVRQPGWPSNYVPIYLFVLR